MKATRVIYRHICSLLILLLVVPVYSQEESVSFTASVSKNTLGVNERLRIDFSMNKDGDNFVPPAFDGFRVLMGPNQSISNSWVNGKRTFSKTYSYILSPLKTGNFRIAQAEVEIGGKIYKTTPVEVSVTSAVTNPNEAPTAEDIAENSIHLVAEVSNANPYINEAIHVVYKLYVSPDVNVSNFVPVDNPTFNNFWSQDLEVKRWDVENGVYQGKQYRYVVLKKVVLYPQTSGKLEIEPLTLDITVDIPTNRRDFFGQRIFKPAHKKVAAGKRVISVKPLPESGKPADFTGAVGNFEMDLIPSKTSLKAGESLTARLVITGSGNFKLFEMPQVSFPSSLEVYDPEFAEQVTTTLAGMRGKVTHSYTVVPQFRGKYPIPQASFSYFDPREERYKTITTPETLIDVYEGPLSQGPVAGETKGTFSQKSPVIASEDHFRFIKLKANWKPRNLDPFFGSALHYVLWFSPLLLIPVALLIRKRRDTPVDAELFRQRQSDKLARKYLSEAKSGLSDSKTFYTALERALHNFLKAKIKAETKDLSKERIKELLAERKVSESGVSSFIGLLSKCELGRYTPATLEGREEDYQQASVVLGDLDKQLRK